MGPKLIAILGMCLLPMDTLADAGSAAPTGKSGSAAAGVVPEPVPERSPPATEVPSPEEIAAFIVSRCQPTSKWHAYSARFEIRVETACQWTLASAWVNTIGGPPLPQSLDVTLPLGELVADVLTVGPDHRDAAELGLPAR